MPVSDRTERPSRRLNTAIAVGVFGTLLALYVFTLLPGLGGTEDTPKFQYIGSVLGTAHNPGYPLYTMLTFAWSHVPIGTLAHRINLFSALWGAAACALVFLAMRSLGVHAAVASSIALAMGLGRTFWQHSVFAEVYSLTAALTAATILLLLWWDRTRRARWLLAAVTAASLAFGAHLIVIGSIPAIVLFVLATYRWRMPWRLVTVSTAIVIAGVAQYGYVWVRTVQHSAYLESSARTPGEFADMMRAKQFESLAFKDPPGVLVSRRVPAVLSEVRAEMGTAAGVAALAGAVLLCWRRPRLGSLVAGAGAGQILLLAMLGDVAVGPIALPAVGLAWMLAGSGFDAIRAGCERRAPRWAAVGAATAPAIATAITLGAGNFAANDHRHDTYDTDYARVLLDTLPAKAAIVTEHYTLDHMLAYEKLVTGREASVLSLPPKPEAIQPMLDEGVPVFVFEGSRALLLHRYVMEPVQLFGLTLDERLTSVGRGITMIIAGSPPSWPPLPSLGLSGGLTPRGRSALVAVKGEGIVMRAPDGSDGRLVIPAGRPIGTGGALAPEEIVTSASSEGAVITIGGEPVISSSRGLVVVELGSRVHDAYAVLPERGLRAPVAMKRRPLFRIVSAIPTGSCAAVGRGYWLPLASTGGQVILGHLDNREPAMAELEMYVASHEPVTARLGEYVGSGTPAITLESFSRAAGDADRLADRLRQDGLAESHTLTAAAHVSRVGVRVNDNGMFSTFMLLLDQPADVVVARGTVDAPTADRAEACVLSPEELRFPPGSSRADLHLGQGGDAYFGRGWGRPQPGIVGYTREVTEPESVLFVPLEAPSGMLLSFRLGTEASGGTIDAEVNGTRLGSRPLPAGWTTTTWSAPAGVWRAGVNRVILRATDGGPLRVRRITLELPGTDANQ